jgi:hypothetical protein
MLGRSLAFGDRDVGIKAIDKAERDISPERPSWGFSSAIAGEMASFERIVNFGFVVETHISPRLHVHIHCNYRGQRRPTTLVSFLKQS